MTPEIEALLSGYSAGILTDEEKERLFRTALEDPEVYQALAAEQPLRELLEQPGVRRELLKALEKEGSAQRLARRFAARRPILAAVAAVLAVAVGAVLLLRQAPRPMPQPTAAPWTQGGTPQWPGMAPIGGRDERLEHDDLLRGLLLLPLQQPFGVELSLDRTGPLPTYAVGGTMRVTFRVERESQVLIVEARSDGTAVEIFPGRPTVLSQVPAGVPQTVPPASLPPLLVSAPEGRRRLRLIALPSGAGPDNLTASQLGSLQPQLAVAEASYEVVRGKP